MSEQAQAPEVQEQAAPPQDEVDPNHPMVMLDLQNWIKLYHAKDIGRQMPNYEKLSEWKFDRYAGYLDYALKKIFGILSAIATTAQEARNEVEKLKAEVDKLKNPPSGT